MPTHRSNENPFYSSRQNDPIHECCSEKQLDPFALTLSQTTNFRFFQNKKIADNNFKFDDNGRKFSNKVENTLGKGEITDIQKPGHVWERVKSLSVTVWLTS